MNERAAECAVPANSKAFGYLSGADFHDAWSIRAKNLERSALEHFAVAGKNTPEWINACMTLRNKVVGLFGLKNLGTLSDVSFSRNADTLRPGDRIGIFTLIENSFEELLVGDDDNHLRVVLSLRREAINETNEVLLTLSTVVHVKNLLGHLYMLPVKPMHRLIAPSVLSRINAHE